MSPMCGIFPFWHYTSQSVCIQYYVLHIHSSYSLCESLLHLKQFSDEQKWENFFRHLEHFDMRKNNCTRDIDTLTDTSHCYRIRRLSYLFKFSLPLAFTGSKNAYVIFRVPHLKRKKTANLLSSLCRPSVCLSVTTLTFSKRLLKKEE